MTENATDHQPTPKRNLCTVRDCRHAHEGFWHRPIPTPRPVYAAAWRAA